MSACCANPRHKPDMSEKLPALLPERPLLAGHV